MFFGTSLGSWLMYSTLISFVILAFGSLVVLLCRQPTRRLRVIELTLFGCLVVPWLGLIPGYPQWDIPWHMAPFARSNMVETTPSEPVPESAKSPTDGVSSVLSQVHAQSTDRLSTSVWDIGLVLVVLYGFGVILSLAWRLVGMVALSRIIATATAAPPHCRELLGKLAGPRSDRVRLLVSHRAKQPFASIRLNLQLLPHFAIHQRAFIVLPKDLCEEQQALSWALAHEWSHIERHDFRVWFMAGLVRIVFYYQPFVWWLCRHLRLCQDFMADARASREASGPEDYAEFLVARATVGSLPPAMVGLGMGFRQSDLYRRVVMLVQHPPVERYAPRLWNVLITLAALIVIGVLPALTLTPETKAAQETQTEKQDETPKVSQQELDTFKKIPLALGPNKFANEGDIIEIHEVRSKKGTLAAGDTVMIKGTYTLVSHDTAVLLFSCTQNRKKGLQASSSQERAIRTGTKVPFEQELPVDTDGYLHFGFYDVQNKKCFGRLYFGTPRQMQEISSWTLDYIKSTSEN